MHGTEKTHDITLDQKYDVHYRDCENHRCYNFQAFVNISGKFTTVVSVDMCVMS